MRRHFGGRSSGEVDTPVGRVEIDSVNDEFAIQAKRITATDKMAGKFSKGNAEQFERTVAYAKEHGKKIMYVITDPVQDSWVAGLLEKAREIGAASGNNPITEIEFAVLDPRTGALLRKEVRAIPR
jgi:hypothetical protein